MSYTKITTRYAAAFFDLAGEKGIIEKANEDMKLLSSVCESNRDFVLLLQNPVVNAEKKKKIIKRIFESSVTPLSISFMSLMIRKRRERYLPSIAKAFTDLYQAYKGIKTAYVTSAVELGAGEREGILEIMQKVTNKKINLIEKTNEELLGGFVINLDNFQLDQSIAAKIKQLKKDFEKNLFVKGF